MIEYNVKQAEGRNAPLGEFDAAIVSSEEGISKSGNTMLVLQAVVSDEYDIVRAWIPIIPSFQPVLKQLLDAVGMDTSQDLSLNAEDLIGKRVRIVTREDGEYEGKTRVRVTQWKAIGTASKPADADADELPTDYGKKDDSAGGGDMPF